MIVSKKFAHCTSIFKQEYNLFHFQDKSPCLDLMHTFWTDQNCNINFNQNLLDRLIQDPIQHLSWKFQEIKELGRH